MRGMQRDSAVELRRGLTLFLRYRRREKLGEARQNARWTTMRTLGALGVQIAAQ